MALTSRLLSFLAASAFSANGDSVGRKVPFYLFDGDATPAIQLSQPLPHCRNKLESLRYVIERHIIGHRAQYVLHKFLIRHNQRMPRGFSCFKSGRRVMGHFLFYTQIAQIDS